MKGFDLSDKELKSLLQNDGMEEPSMGFNQNVLSKIEAYEKKKAQPIRAPKWLIFSLLLLFITPAIYILAKNGFSLLNGLETTQFLSFDFNLGISSTFVWISVLAVGMIWTAVFFDRFLLKRSVNHR